MATYMTIREGGIFMRRIIYLIWIEHTKGVNWCVHFVPLPVMESSKIFTGEMFPS